MNGVKFIKQDGNLNRRLPNGTHISGLLIYNETAVEKTVLYAIEELEDLGVTNQTHPITHYHVSEFFRINPGAKLYLETVANSDGAYTEVKVLQNFAGGNLRRVAVCDILKPVSEWKNDITTINKVAKDLFDINTPLSILFSGKIEATDMANLPDLHTLDSEFVSVVIGQDGAGRGNYIAQTTPSVSCIGALLGASSKADIHESIAWVERQNLISGAYLKALTGDKSVAFELDVPAFCDGSKIGDYTLQQIQAINDKGYIFLINHTGIAGTYANDSYTATSLDSDFVYIENNTTIAEAIRAVHTALIPRISGPVYIDPDTGYINEGSTSALEGFCDDALIAMENAGQISGYSIYINPDQKVLSTSKLEVVLKIVPVGVLREIVVKIGLTLQK